MKAYWEVEIYLHAFLTSALAGSDWSASRLNSFIKYLYQQTISISVINPSSHIPAHCISYLPIIPPLYQQNMPVQAIHWDLV
jgi:hypothetical protein